MAKDSIVDFIKSEKLVTDKELKKFFDRQVSEARRVDDRFYRMAKMMSDQVLRGGKRARPLLVRLAYDLAGGKKKKEIVKASLFVELIHEFLLVHDDIADKDFKRYGGPTLEVAVADWFKKEFKRENRHFGMTLAMLGGDHLRTLAHRALHESEFDAEKKTLSELKMARTLEDTFVGWQIHFWQNNQKLSDSNEKKFLKGMELVSARYTFEAPLMVGLILAGKENAYGKLLKKYAYHAGMAFQIQDDILGVFGETEKTGKPVGNDIREGKKTLLVLRAYKNSGAKERKVLEKAVGNENLDGEIKRVRQIIIDSGSLDYSVKKAKRHVAEAVIVLEELRPKAKNEMAVDRLAQIAEFVVARSY